MATRHALSTPTPALRMTRGVNWHTEWSVDELFSNSSSASTRPTDMAQGQRLGFAHWDVEGMELDVLVGARNILQRDRPIFTVEMFVHTSSHWRRVNLFKELSLSGYEAYLVEEPCGYTIDCRSVSRSLSTAPRIPRAYTVLTLCRGLPVHSRMFGSYASRSALTHTLPRA